MSAIYDTPLYPYARHPDQDGRARHPVVIIGAGPVGLALAIDLALKGIKAIVLDDNDGISLIAQTEQQIHEALNICGM